MDMNDIVAFLVGIINAFFKLLNIDFELEFSQQNVV